MSKHKRGVPSLYLGYKVWQKRSMINVDFCSILNGMNHCWQQKAHTVFIPFKKLKVRANDAKNIAHKMGQGHLGGKQLDLDVYVHAFNKINSGGGLQVLPHVWIDRLSDLPIYLSGIPWQITLFTDVHTDFGKPPYLSGDGYALCLIVSWCTMKSISSVVIPTWKTQVITAKFFTKQKHTHIICFELALTFKLLPASSSTCLASWQALARPSISPWSFISM